MHHTIRSAPGLSCLIASCLTLSWRGQAAGQLLPGPSVIGSEGGPDRVLAVDLDDDGHIDLVATAPATGRLSLHLGRGGGLFRFPLFLTAGSRVSALNVADIDGNGQKDLIGTDPLSGELVLIQQFRGTQAPYRTLRLPGEDEPSAITVYDLEPDGDPDVLVAFPGADAVGLYLNEGGVLQLPQLRGIGDSPNRMRVLSASTPSLRRFLVAQNGVLSRNLVVYDDQWNSRQVIAVAPIGGLELLDWNADTATDFLLIDQGGWARVFLGSATDFSPGTVWPISPGATSATEFRASDGRVGAAILETQNNRVSVHIDGAAVTPDPAWFVGGGAQNLLRADLDANGVEELVVPVPEDNLLLILRRDGDGLRGYRSYRSGDLPSRIRSTDAVGGLPPRVFVLCPGSNSLWVYEQVHGDLSPMAPMAVALDSRDFRLAQLDGDGLPDIVVLSLTQGIQIFASAGASFAAPQTIAITGQLRDLEVLHLPGDALADLAVADQEVNGIRLLRADGMGGFSETDTLTSLDPPIVLRSDDFDRDGRDDLLCVGDDRRPSLFYANANGTFQRTNWLLGNELRGVAIGDFNGDIYPDIAIGNAEDRTYSVLASVTARFHAVTEADRAAPDGSETIAATDVNGDGLDDLVLSSSNSRSVSIHFATGAGQFAPPSRVRCSTLPLDLHAFDVDGDFVRDILVTDGFGASVVALRVLGGTQAIAASARTGSVSSLRRQELDVTPNPARGLVQLRVQGPGRVAEFQLFDLRGRLVARIPSRLESGGWYGGQLDVGPLAAGRYFVQALVGDRQLVRSLTRMPG